MFVPGLDLPVIDGAGFGNQLFAFVNLLVAVWLAYFLKGGL